jgi:hypothetical protein
MDDMNVCTRRNVLLDGEPPPSGETERFVEVPKGNDRMFAIELRNRGRVQRGTATIWRWRTIVEAIQKRHPGACISPRHKRPITVRSRKAGPVVVTLTPLDGPVRRLMN